MSRCARLALLALLAFGALALASCGGGSASPASSSTGSSTSSSGSCTGSTAGGAQATANVVALVVDAGCGGVNQAYVTITICVPGTANCQAIDHVWVDTGSSGLRLVASAVSLSLPLSTQGGAAVANCGQFISNYTWGAVRSADVRIGGELAAAVPIQVIGDTASGALPAAANAPSSCASGAVQNTVGDIGANGILGIGLLAQDCGIACGPGFAMQAGYYYLCTGGNCPLATVAVAQQLQNVVGMFAADSSGIADNNGAVLQLPAIAAAGQTSSVGSLTFGINTRSNNMLGSALVFNVDSVYGDANFGDVDTTFGSAADTASYIDSGSNGWFFDDSGASQCTSSALSGFYCQALPSLTATLSSYGGAAPSFPYTFSIADLSQLNGSFAAFDNIGGPASAGTFDWGLPFFYGRSVYIALENAPVVGAGTGPFVAATTP